MAVSAWNEININAGAYTQECDHSSHEPVWLRLIILASILHKHNDQWIYRNKILQPQNTAD